MASCKTFVVWPADAAGKAKKPHEVSLKLNACMLKPMVGRAELYPKLIAVSELQPMLMGLAAHLNVSELHSLFFKRFGLLLLFIFAPESLLEKRKYI